VHVCGYMMDIYMVTNLILRCSLKTHLSFELWKHLLENSGYLIHFFLFFLRRVSKYPLFYISRTLAHFFQIFFFFMNNFCIAPCLFPVTKLLTNSNKNLEHLFGGWKTYQVCFCVHPQYRSRACLGRSRWKICYCTYPLV
jgi:hypothetical protein